MSADNEREYGVKRVTHPPTLVACPGRLPAAWRQAERACIGWYHPAGGDHRPQVEFRLLYDAHALYVRFDVADRYVRCVHTTPQSPVCRDSCVEFFVAPQPGRGYFNFEINAGGTPFISHVTDHHRLPDGSFAAREMVADEWVQQVAIAHTLPSRVEPEISRPVRWSVAYRIPLALFTAYLGSCGIAPGDCWRANFYKCGDRTSHPHWGAWSAIKGKLNFHKPRYFGRLRFM